MSNSIQLNQSILNSLTEKQVTKNWFTDILQTSTTFVFKCTIKLDILPLIYFRAIPVFNITNNKTDVY